MAQLMATAARLATLASLLKNIIPFAINPIIIAAQLTDPLRLLRCVSAAAAVETGQALERCARNRYTALMARALRCRTPSLSIISFRCALHIRISMSSGRKCAFDCARGDSLGLAGVGAFKANRTRAPPISRLKTSIICSLGVLNFYGQLLRASGARQS